MGAEDTRKDTEPVQRRIDAGSPAPSSDLSETKSFVLHNAQTTVSGTISFLNSQSPIHIEDGKVATMEAFSPQEIQTLIGDLPRSLQSSIDASARPQYNGPLLRLNTEQKGRLSAMINADWSDPANITRLVEALNGEFQNCYEGKRIAKIAELADVITGKSAPSVNGRRKSVNKATSAQIANYCEQQKQTFLAWLRKGLEDERYKLSTAQTAYLMEMIVFVTASDFTDIERLRAIIAMTGSQQTPGAISA